mmetsp:Transcript_35131/g.111698  ORF Transcript_35131/g.111698 Transcript_35131/m.111698 type:complete len:302 (+) Transcript_35131:430-1335(+)
MSGASAHLEQGDADQRRVHQRGHEKDQQHAVGHQPIPLQHAAVLPHEAARVDLDGAAVLPRKSATEVALQHPLHLEAVTTADNAEEEDVEVWHEPLVDVKEEASVPDEFDKILEAHGIGLRSHPEGDGGHRKHSVRYRAERRAENRVPRQHVPDLLGVGKTQGPQGLAEAAEKGRGGVGLQHQELHGRDQVGHDLTQHGPLVVVDQIEIYLCRQVEHQVALNGNSVDDQGPEPHAFDVVESQAEEGGGLPEDADPGLAAGVRRLRVLRGRREERPADGHARRAPGGTRLETQPAIVPGRLV